MGLKTLKDIHLYAPTQLRADMKKQEIKEEAIKRIKVIQSGSGIDRTKFPEDMKGSSIKDKWNDGFTTLALEYGFIIGIMEFLDITGDDLK